MVVGVLGGVWVWQCGNKIIRLVGRLSKLNCKSIATNSSFCLISLPYCGVAFYFCVDLLILSVTEFEMKHIGILYG